jgi:hypothetical protein
MLVPPLFCLFTHHRFKMIPVAGGLHEWETVLETVVNVKAKTSLLLSAS